MVRRARKDVSLEKALGYRFRARDLLERALTHSSVRSGGSGRQDNERLEFIGDRVLGLAIAELLNEVMPTANEGQLARRFNGLVRGGACAQVAREIGLGAHLTLSESEAESGGRSKETILADAMEAVLGAVFVDGGFEAARKIVHTLWASQLKELGDETVDAKSALQEWAQGNGLALPAYIEVSRSGPDHAPRFVSEVRIAGQRAARGEGSSKRAAEQAAATAMLTRQGVWKEAPDV